MNSSVTRPRSAKGGGPKRLELLLEPADPAAHDQPSPREDVDGCQHFGGEHRLALRHHHHGAQQIQAFGTSGEEGQGGDEIEAFTDRGAGPLAIAAIRVLRVNSARHDPVVIDAEKTEAEALGGLGNGDVALTCARLSPCRGRHAKVHVLHLCDLAPAAKSHRGAHYARYTAERASLSAACREPNSSDVKIGYSQRVRLDELTARLDDVAHQPRKDFIGLTEVADLHLQERARLFVEGRFPE